MHAPVIVVPCSSKAAYLKRYAQPDKGWTDEDEARWPVPFWHIDTGMAALLILQTVTDEGLGACYFGIPPERVARRPRRRSAIPETFDPIGAITIGHRTTTDGLPGSPSVRPRKAQADVVHHGRWALNLGVARPQSIGRTPPGQRASRRRRSRIRDDGRDVAPQRSVACRTRFDQGVPMIHAARCPTSRSPTCPLTDYVLARADELGDKPALIDGPSGRTLTYGGPQAGRPRPGRRPRGPRLRSPARRWRSWRPNLPEYAIVFHGVAYAGGVVTTINPTYIEREVHHQLVDAGRPAAGDRGAVPRDRPGRRRGHDRRGDLRDRRGRGGPLRSPT